MLTTGSWPTQTATTCTLPREVETACTRFQDFYLRTHSGRKLSWQTNMGNAGDISTLVPYTAGSLETLRALSLPCCCACSKAMHPDSQKRVFHVSSSHIWQHIHWLSCVRFVAAWLQLALQAQYLPSQLFKSLQDMHYSSMQVMHHGTVQGCVASHRDQAL